MIEKKPSLGKENKKEERLLELDSLRGLAALLVVIYHFFFRYDQLYGHEFTVPDFIAYGKYGVQLFFMVSGFVIYMSISRTSKPQDFIYFRLARLYPSYWLAIILTFIVVSFLGLPGREVTVEEAILNFSMVHKLFDIPSVDGVYWTLLVELKFYSIMFFVFYLFKIKNMEVFTLVWMFALFITWLGVENDVSFSSGLANLLLMPYAPLFSAGILFYIIQKGDGKALTYLSLWVTFFAVIVCVDSKAIPIVLVYYGIFICLVKGWLKFLRTKFLISIGASSYFLYLIHQNIGYAVMKFLNVSSVITILFLISVITIGAIYLTKYIEMPFYGYLKKLRAKQVAYNSPAVIKEG